MLHDKNGEPQGPELPPERSGMGDAVRTVTRTLGSILLSAAVLLLLAFLIFLGRLLFAAAKEQARIQPRDPLPGMSEDFADFTVGYGGDVCTLPAPMSEFLAGGWEIRRMTAEELEQKVQFYSSFWTDEQVQAYRARERAWPDSPDELLEAGGELSVRIRREDETDVITVWNPAGTALPLRDCFVAELSTGSGVPRLIITGGITHSTGEYYLELALEGTAFTHTVSTDYSNYSLRYSEQSYYKISCLTMFGSKVQVIQVCNKVPPDGPSVAG